ncbi:alpha/beta hydrolase [Rhizobium sp. 1399]|uniref:alpha/beta fold hydrolase n=1 Tax=Rhizobium sp. 1399 TaxID=2817758 RepID=UPI00285D6396|nr:alpha/beta hydrolase [Rhizobium sp. 1399]MDR6670922.1 pimeloyl-ACP methyl ester carboxylesterase [Rhizobium sp. 1399]
MQKNFTTTDGAVLTYTDEGQGPALIMLPGWSQSAAMFRHQIGHFSPTNRVLAVDFRGHGKSPDAARGFRIFRFAADIMELMKHEKIEKATLLGWSMGASVIWAMIDIFGTVFIDKLILIDEPATVMRQAGMSNEDVLNSGALFDAATMIAIADQIKGAEGATARGAFLDGMITKGIPADLKAWLLQENLRVNAVHIANLFVDHCSIDWRDIFSRIDRPTLVIGGRVSHVNPRSQEWIHGQIKGSRLVIFEEAEGGAHFAFIEAPERFNEVVSDFLAGQ